MFAHIHRSIVLYCLFLVAHVSNKALVCRGFVCVCVFVSVCLCLPVCLSFCLSVCLYACLSVSVCVCINMRYACINMHYVCMHTYHRNVLYALVVFEAA